MTEDRENMDKRALQQKSVVLQKKNGGHDAKRFTQRPTKIAELTRSGSNSPLTKHTFADNRYQAKISKKKGKSKGSQPISDVDKFKDNDDELDFVDDSKEYRKLLNFKFDPPNRCHVGSVGRKPFRSWNPSKSPVYNKETYLQANCQFVVKSTGDYLVHAVDPDILVDWHLVEQVNILSHEMISCPICLEKPIAAKMTRCGHVYCWSCILHYLKLSDKPWRKCPICYEAIAPADLKSVVSTCTFKVVKGKRITMRLMKRKKGYVLPWPVLHQHTDEDHFAEWKGETEGSFSKLVISNPKTVHNDIIMREMNELEDQLDKARAEKSGEECFIESALVILKEKENKVLQEIREYESASCGKKEKAAKQKKEKKNESSLSASVMEQVNKKISTLSMEEPAFSDDEVEIVDSDIKDPVEPTANTTAVKEVADISVCGKPDSSNQAKYAEMSNQDYCYFYQAEDGQNIFLQPTNIRCLVHEYGNLEACPEKITAQIIDIEHFTMTKDLRKRYRFLSHLPVSCGFSFCELMLRPPIVSRETLSEFSQEFQVRKLQRQKKKREERKQEQRMENRKTMDMFGREIQRPGEEISWNLESYQEFPSQASESLSESLSDYPSLIDAPTSPQSWGCSSFAEALQSNSKAVIPKEKQIRSQHYAVNTVRDSGTNLNSDGEVDEDYVPVPSFSRAFSDALNASWDNIDSKKVESPCNPCKGNKKKQKGKKLLFSTGGMMKYS